MSVFRTAMVWLGLVDDDEYDGEDDQYYLDDEYEDAPRRAGRQPRPRPARHGHEARARTRAARSRARSRCSAAAATATRAEARRAPVAARRGRPR